MVRGILHDCEIFANLRLQLYSGHCKVVEDNASLLFRLHRPARPHVGAGGEAEVLADGGGGGVLPRQVRSQYEHLQKMSSILILK